MREDVTQPLNVELRAARMKLNLHKKYHHADTPLMEKNWDEAMETIGKTISTLEAQPHDAEALAVAIEGLKIYRKKNDEEFRHTGESALDEIINTFEALVQFYDAEGQRVLKEIEKKVEAMTFLGFMDKPIIIRGEIVVSKKEVLAIICEASQSEAQPLTREDKEAEDACPAHGPKCNPHPDCIDNPNCSCHAEGREAVTREGAGEKA